MFYKRLFHSMGVLQKNTKSLPPKGIILQIARKLGIAPTIKTKDGKKYKLVPIDPTLDADNLPAHLRKCLKSYNK